MGGGGAWSPVPIHASRTAPELPNPIRWPVDSVDVRSFMSATVPRARRVAATIARRCADPEPIFADRWSLALLLQKFSVTECGLVGAGCATNLESSQSSPVLWCPAARLHHPFRYHLANLKRKQGWVITTDRKRYGTSLPPQWWAGAAASLQYSSPTTLGAWVSRDPASHVPVGVAGTAQPRPLHSRTASCSAVLADRRSSAPGP